MAPDVSPFRCSGDFETLPYDSINDWSGFWVLGIRYVISNTDHWDNKFDASCLISSFVVLASISFTTSSICDDEILFLVIAGHLDKISKTILINSSSSIPCKTPDNVLYPCILTINEFTLGSSVICILIINFAMISCCCDLSNAAITLETSTSSIGSISKLCTKISLIVESSSCWSPRKCLFSFNHAFSIFEVTPRASAIPSGNNNAASVCFFPPINLIQLGSPQ